MSPFYIRLAFSQCKRLPPHPAGAFPFLNIILRYVQYYSCSTPKITAVSTTTALVTVWMGTAFLQ